MLKNIIMFFIIILIILIIGYLILIINKKKKIEPYTSHKKIINELKNTVSIIIPEIKNINVVYSKNKSYTADKKVIHLCLMDETGNYYSKNMLIYVLLHELSHCYCKSLHHTPEFLKIFEALLKKAVDAKIYDPNFKKPKIYCGVRT